MKTKLAGLIGCAVLLLAAIVLGCFIEYRPLYSSRYGMDRTYYLSDEFASWKKTKADESDFLFRNFVFSSLADEISGNALSTVYALDRDGSVFQIQSPPSDILDGKAGFVIELAPAKTKNSEAIYPFSKYRLFIHKDRELSLVYPEDLSDEDIKSVKDEMSYFEKTLYSYDCYTVGYGYDNFIDVKSFADCYLLTEAACPESLIDCTYYFYKNTKGKYGVFLSDYSGSDLSSETKNFISTDLIWLSMLLRNDSFTDKVIAEYKTLREGALSDDFVSDTVAKAKEYLSEYYPSCHVSDEEADTFLSGLLTRLAFMDENIESLRQYSAKSAIKNYTDDPY